METQKELKKLQIQERTLNNKVTFKNVFCLDDIVNQFKELGELITNYKYYEEKGIRFPYGILLLGNPGTGKTLITNAFINEYNLNRYDYIEPPKKEDSHNFDSIREIFIKARKNKPAIIVIDEIDKIEIPSLLLQEMSGQINNNGVLVIAMANSKQRLKRSLLRAGRFDRVIYFPTLNRRTIKIMFEKKFEALNIKHDLDLEIITETMTYANPAEIDTYVNEAILKATMQNNGILTNDILLDTIRFVDFGFRMPEKISEKAKEQIYVHEAGHAVMAALIYGPESIGVIDACPGGQYEGYIKLIHKEDQLNDEIKFFNDIKISLGGYVAEKLFTKAISTGAESDLTSVRRRCEEMIVSYGFSSPTMVLVTMFEYRSVIATEKMKDRVIDEAIKIVNKAEQEVIETLLANENLLKELVALLRVKPQLFKNDFIHLFKNIEINKKS